MRYFMPILKLFPPMFINELSNVTAAVTSQIEELRVRIGMPIVARGCFGEVTTNSVFCRNDMKYLIGNATECSYHAHIREIENGYISLPNGGRLGICGEGNGREGVLRSVGEITSVCIRIAREHKGSADDVYRQLFSDGLCSCVIVGPPGAGKTSLLRELVTTLSENGVYVGVADERGEIGGRKGDGEGFYLGSRTDVMNGVSKCDGALMLLRTMSPQVIAMDEITAREDLQAVEAITKAGVEILATLHGNDMNALFKSSFAPIYNTGVFKRAVFVGSCNGVRRYTVEGLNA